MSTALSLLAQEWNLSSNDVRILKKMLPSCPVAVRGEMASIPLDVLGELKPDPSSLFR